MTKNKERFSKSVNIKNKRASFEFQFLDTYVAGIALTGSEIKSIREGKVNLTDAFCYIHNGEVWVKGMHISPYANASFNAPDPVRERKLLLNRREIKKLDSQLKEKGLTLVVVRLFINDKGLAKLEIALAKGKKLFDKRESIKEKDVKRDMDRLRF
jgi:SsrA-binding protein